MWLYSKYFAAFFIWTWTGGYCKPMINDLNTNLRDYSVTEDHINSTNNVKTLQKEDVARYAYSAPKRRPIVFKEIPDNALSGSTHSRAVHHEHGGYGLHDFDDHGYGHGYGFDHYDHDYHGGYHGHPLSYGHHHKHYDPGLAAKTLLLPIAGIAILGAAAALASNPILLQLGVISGRKRRDTEAQTFDLNLESWTRKDEDSTKVNGIEIQKNFKRKHDINESTTTPEFGKQPVVQNKDNAKGTTKDKGQNKEGIKDYSSKKVLQQYKLKKSMSSKQELTVQSAIETVTPEAQESRDGDRLIPVALKIRA